MSVGGREREKGGKGGKGRWRGKEGQSIMLKKNKKKKGEHELGRSKYS